MAFLKTPKLPNYSKMLIPVPSISQFGSKYIIMSVLLP